MMDTRPVREWPILSWEDELGPSKVIFLHDSHSGLKAIVVLDNLALGPAIGGVRMLTDISPDEIFRLARAMTLKSAAAGLPHGGAKSGIIADSESSAREILIRSFARGIAELTEYIPAPDMGTDESCMAVIHAEIGRAVGLPRSLRGIPVDEIGATGFGLAECADVAASFMALGLKGARLSVEGFGHVGEHAARFLTQKGAVLVAASDIHGLIYDPDGLDFDALVQAKRETGTIGHYGRAAHRMPKEEIFSVPCDIFVPAARPDSLNERSATRLQARLVVEGANLPATATAETILHRRGILVIPDFIANAAGLSAAVWSITGGARQRRWKSSAKRSDRTPKDSSGWPSVIDACRARPPWA